MEDNQKQEAVEKQCRIYIELIATRTELLTEGNKVFERSTNRNGASFPNILDDLLSLTYTELSSPIAMHAARVKKDWQRLQYKLSVPLTFAVNQPRRSMMDDSEHLFLHALEETSNALWEVRKVKPELPEDLEGICSSFERNSIRAMESELLGLEELDQVVKTGVRLGNELQETLKRFCEEPDSNGPSLVIRRADYATFCSHLKRTKRTARFLTGNNAYHEDDHESLLELEDEDDRVSIFEDEDRPITGVAPDTLGDSLQTLKGKLQLLWKFCDNCASYNSTSASDRVLWKLGSELSQLCIETVKRVLLYIEWFQQLDPDKRLSVQYDERIEADIYQLYSLAHGFCQQGPSETCTLLDRLVVASSHLNGGSSSELHGVSLALTKAIMDVEQSWRLVLGEERRPVPLVDRRNDASTTITRDPTDASFIQHSLEMNEPDQSSKRKWAASDLSDRPETAPTECAVSGSRGLCEDRVSALQSLLRTSKQQLCDNLASGQEESTSLLNETLRMLDELSKLTELQTQTSLPAGEAAEIPLSGTVMSQTIANLSKLCSTWSERDESDSTLSVEAALTKIIAHFSEMRSKFVAEGDIKSGEENSSIGTLTSFIRNSRARSSGFNGILSTKRPRLFEP
ncbi:hypothetical protein QFC19_000145 [Naganishia cerealis]|uniref:Uncharacterized protein n=1 Tax=Naganishia cerealis TaxID=610337 RepID=A0ACC2WQ90_9TREE|nr:hypothetical protein QFC19_000145 [Naganishia cerealis]